MVDGIFVSVNTPLQSIAGNRFRYRQAVVYSGFKLRSFFVIVPCHQLQVRQLMPRIVHAVQFGKGLQPGLAALLVHDSI